MGREGSWGLEGEKGQCMFHNYTLCRLLFGGPRVLHTVHPLTSTDTLQDRYYYLFLYYSWGRWGPWGSGRFVSVSSPKLHSKLIETGFRPPAMTLQPVVFLLKKIFFFTTSSFLKLVHIYLGIFTWIVARFKYCFRKKTTSSYLTLKLAKYAS